MSYLKKWYKDSTYLLQFIRIRYTLWQHITYVDIVSISCCLMKFMLLTMYFYYVEVVIIYCIVLFLCENKELKLQCPWYAKRASWVSKMLEDWPNTRKSIRSLWSLGHYYSSFKSIAASPEERHQLNWNPWSRKNHPEKAHPPPFVAFRAFARLQHPPKGHGVQLLDAICTILISRPLSRFRRDTSEEESDEFVIPRRTVQAPKLAKPRVQKKKVVIPKKNPARSVPPLKRKIEELVPGPPPGPPPKRMRPSASSIPSRKWHDLSALSKPTILSHMYILWPNVTYTSKTMYNCFFWRNFGNFLNFYFRQFLRGVL